MRMRAPANSTTGRPAVTMLQRPAPTPFVRVLLSVAVYAAVLTMVGRAAVCRAAGELKDACINYEGSVTELHIAEFTGDDCVSRAVNCSGERLALLQYTYLHRGRGKLAAKVSWIPDTSVSQYFLQTSRDGGQCRRYRVASPAPPSGSLSLTPGLFQYATYEPRSSLHIQVLAVEGEGSECVAGETSLRVPATCYDALRDCSLCGDFGENLDYSLSDLSLSVESGVSMATGDGLQSREVVWQWNEDGGRGYRDEVYHVRMRGGDIVNDRWREVKGKMRVVLHNLNSSLQYDISVWRYECGCAQQPMGHLVLSPLASSLLPSPLSTAHLSPDSTLFTPLSCSSSSTSSHHPPLSITITPTPIPNSQFSPTPSSPIFTTTTTGTGTTTDTSNQLVIAFTVSVATIVVIAVVLVVVLIFVCVIRPRPLPNEGDKDEKPIFGTPNLLHIPARPSTPDSLADAPSTIDSLPSTPVSSQTARLSVLILYSERTSEPEKTVIHNLLVGGLSQCQIHVETPGTAQPRELGRDWIDRRVRHAHAVLLVCNKQLHQEWQGEGEGEGEGFHMGHAVKVILESLGKAELRKMRCVCLNQEDKRYSHPSVFLSQPFCLSDSPTVEVAIETMARFIGNVPEYSIAP